MIVTTTDDVAGMEVAETLGLVCGNTVRARFFVRDFLAGLKNLVGGEVSTYTRMIAEAREQAIVRMIEQADEKGADAVIGVRFTTSAVMRSSAEVLAYGTAVKLRPAHRPG